MSGRKKTFKKYFFVLKLYYAYALECRNKISHTQLIFFCVLDFIYTHTHHTRICRFNLIFFLI